MNKTEMAELIWQQMLEVSRENLGEMPLSHVPLADVGLDSLSFAVVIVRLEDRLGYDPFLKMRQSQYPHTFGEFVEAYVRAE